MRKRRSLLPERLTVDAVDRADSTSRLRPSQRARCPVREHEAEATVAIESPGRPLPFFLPRDCTSGVVEIKDSANNNANITYDPPSSNGSSVAKIDSVNPTTTPGQVASNLSLFGTKFTATMGADFFQESTGDRVPANTANATPVTLVNDTPSNKDEADEAAVALPPGVYNRPGAWLVRVNNGSGFSKTVGRFIVGNPTPPPAGCGQSPLAISACSTVHVSVSPSSLRPPRSTSLRDWTTTWRSSPLRCSRHQSRTRVMGWVALLQPANNRQGLGAREHVRGDQDRHEHRYGDRRIDHRGHYVQRRRL